MDPILYRPLDVLDERLRRDSPYQRHQPRPGGPAPGTPPVPRPAGRRWPGPPTLPAWLRRG